MGTPVKCRASQSSACVMLILTGTLRQETSLGIPEQHDHGSGNPAFSCLFRKQKRLSVLLQGFSPDPCVDIPSGAISGEFMSDSWSLALSSTH